VSIVPAGRVCAPMTARTAFRGMVLPTSRRRDSAESFLARRTDPPHDLGGAAVPLSTTANVVSAAAARRAAVGAFNVITLEHAAAIVAGAEAAGRAVLPQ